MRNSDIPNDVVADILFRLPPKTVFRFKTVSKTWYTLISDPLFIKLHSQKVSPNSKILLSTTKKSNLLRSELKLLDYEGHSLEISGPFNFQKEESPLQPYKIIGSSLGLVCIATDYCANFYVWNPTTRESRKIPNIGSEKIQHYEYIHGLGYNSDTNDFKVVISLYPVEYTGKPITFNVFSLRKNSWKEIVSPFGYHYNPSKYPSDWQFPFEHYGTTKLQFEDYAATTVATVLNGVFHWIVRVPNEDDPQIIAFDSTKETFHKLQIPKEKFHELRIAADEVKGYTLLTLLEQNGCLCFFCYNSYSPFIKEIWMMKEYGNHGSWIHLHNVSMVYGIDAETLYKTLCITRNTGLLLHTADKIKICRRKTTIEMKKLPSLEEEFIDAWNLSDQGNISTDLVTLQRESIFGAALVDETLVSPHDITSTSRFNLEFNFFPRVFEIFWVVINVLMNLCRVFKLYLFKGFM